MTIWRRSEPYSFFPLILTRLSTLMRAVLPGQNRRAAQRVTLRTDDGVIHRRDVVRAAGVAARR